MGEALAFAGVAAAAQVVQSAAEARARNNAPVTRTSTGVAVSPQCDNEGQYSCVTLSTPSPGERPPMQADAPMSSDEAREYVLGYVNGVRKLNAAPPVARDEAVDAFAQAGSDQLADDHKPGRHLTEHARDLPAGNVELQGSPDGAPGGSLQDVMADILLRWMGEGAGGMHHDALLKGAWHKLGVGITSRGGRVFVNVDFTE
jgi:uncharacterized protein YkwD